MSSPNNPSSNCAWAFVAGVLLLSFFLAGRKIEDPGLYHDEMLFVNAARGGAADIFVQKRLMGVPVLLMDYIGAIKAWIYYPIFSIFGISPGSVRWPAIVLAQAGGLFCLMGLQRLYGARVLIFGAPLLLLDPSVLMHSRLDWGPNALMFLMRGLLIFALCAWLARPDPRWIFLVLAAVVAGVFDKLNFLWCALGICGSFGVVFIAKIWTDVRRAPLPYALGFASIAAVILATAYRAAHLSANLTKVPMAWSARMSEVGNLLRLLLSGGGPLEFVSGDGLHFWPWMSIAWLVVPGFVSIVWLRTAPAGRARLNFWILALLGTTALFSITKLAAGPHHAAMMAALPQLIFLCAFAEAWSDPSPFWQKLLQRGFGVGATVLILSFITISYYSVQRFAEPKNANWDPVNDRAGKFAADLDESAITADWGLATQLAAYARNPRNVSDQWPHFTSKSEAFSFVRTLDKKRSFIVIYHLPGFEVMPGSFDNLEASLEAEGFLLSPLRTFSTLSGHPAVNVARVSAKHL